MDFKLISQEVDGQNLKKYLCGIAYPGNLGLTLQDDFFKLSNKPI